MLLEQIWSDVLDPLDPDLALKRKLFKEIVAAHSEKHRHYHNLSHLEYMMAHAVRIKDRLNSFNTMAFSIFYHDFVYSIIRKDNEERSAQKASRRLASLGTPQQVIDDCSAQILATKQHDRATDHDTNYLLDFDLAILGEPENRYREYMKNIRAEYSIYPDLLYNKGRMKVLEHFLTMDRIFKTEAFFTTFEEQARRNLMLEITELA